jgi:hypothetical protein
MNNDSEKFINTYGKETSFEIFPQEASYIAPEKDRPVPAPFSLTASIRKYMALTLFISIVAAFLLIGGFVMVIFLALMLVSLIIRSIFFKSNSGTSSSIFIFKK